MLCVGVMLRGRIGRYEEKTPVRKVALTWCCWRVRLDCRMSYVDTCHSANAKAMKERRCYVIRGFFLGRVNDFVL